jgi:hypothetical protein
VLPCVAWWRCRQISSARTAACVKTTRCLAAQWTTSSAKNTAGQQTQRTSRTRVPLPERPLLGRRCIGGVPHRATDCKPAHPAQSLAFARQEEIPGQWHAVGRAQYRGGGKSRRAAAKTPQSDYSGRQTRHPQNAQRVVAPQTRESRCGTVSKGREHYCTLCKRRHLPLAAERTWRADKGSQGGQTRHSNSQTPQQTPHGGALNKPEPPQNRALSRQRVVGEHVRGKVHGCRILGETYRNSRRRFGVRWH